MFRGYHSYLMDIGSTPETWREELKGILLQSGWRVFREDTINNILEVTPSATEPIGNEQYFQYIRIEFTSGETRITPQLYARSGAKEYGEVRVIHVNNNYLPTARTVTINGEAFNVPVGVPTYVEMAESLAAQITANTYLMDSVLDRVVLYLDSVILHYKVGVEPEVNSGGTHYFAQRTWQYPVSAEAPVASVSEIDPVSVKVDYDTGFIYYLSVFDRTFSLATKTTAGFFGPIVASYADNTEARLQAPAGVPIVELLCATMARHASGPHTTNHNSIEVPALERSDLRLTHVYGRELSDRSNSSNFTFPDSTDAAVGYRIVPYRRYLPNLLMEGGMQPTAIGTRGLFHASGARSKTYEGSPMDSGLFGLGIPYVNNTVSTYGALGYVKDAFGDSWGIQSTALIIHGGRTVVGASNSTAPNHEIYPTRLYFPNVYLLVDPSIDESLNLAKDANVVTQLAEELLVASDEIELGDGSGFPEDGATIFIGQEILTYTLRSGNTLTGCRRARLGSVSSSHNAGAEVTLGAWFIKINSGALFVGNKRPTSG